MIDFRMNWTGEKVRTHLFVLLAYVAAIAGGYFSLSWVPHWEPIWQLALADLVGTIIIFGFSLAVQNTSMYDPYWSVIPPFLWLFWMLQPEAAQGEPLRQLLVGIPVALWAIRLTFNWMRYFDNLHHEDWRYLHYKEKIRNPFLYWPFSFLGLHLVPTIVVFGACLSFWPAVTTGATSPIGVLDILAFMLANLAWIIELVADEQLRRFTQDPANKGKIMDRGIWAWSRHPNYFGENLFWWALSLFALSANPAYWWVVLGPLVNTVLFIGASLPLMETRSRERRPGYAEHAHRVSLIIPWPPKKG
jgi:steroid 5-alpha reductase family enzyme